MELIVEYTQKVYVYVDTDTLGVSKVVSGDDAEVTGTVYDEEFNLVWEDGQSVATTPEDRKAQRNAEIAKSIAEESEWPAWDHGF